MPIELELTLRLSSPLALHRSRSAVQYVETLDYIPGSSLRGALAQKYLAENGQPDETFKSLFLSGKVQYTDLWPATEDRPTVLIPATARSCKRYHLNHPESFCDILLDAFGIDDGTLTCPNPSCKEHLGPVSGYLHDLSTERIVPRSRLKISTAISRGTGTVARKMLFTQHTLIGWHSIAGTVSPKLGFSFQGSIRLIDPSLQGELEKQLPIGTNFSIGAGRSRGLGEVVVQDRKRASNGTTLEERWHKFNESAHAAGGDRDSAYFSLTLLSHLALRDNALRPVLGAIKPNNLGLPNGVEMACYASTREPVVFLDKVVVQGWNAAQGLPKSDTVALSRGSVLLFRCDPALQKPVLSRLAQIEDEGFGERRDEGFGRIAACYPVHYVFRGLK